MDVKVEKFDALRAYVLEYATGLLWLVSLAGLLGADRYAFKFDLSRLLVGSDRITFAGQVVIVAATVVFGVVVPYCVAAVFRPVSLLLFDQLLRIERFWARRKNAPTPASSPIATPAAAVIRETIAMPQLQPGRAPKLMYIDIRNSKLLRRIERDRDELWFRVSAALPTALLLALIAAKIAPPASAAGVAAGIAVATFLIAARQANHDLGRWDEAIDSAVILAARELNNAATTALPMPVVPAPTLVETAAPQESPTA